MMPVSGIPLGLERVFIRPIVPASSIFQSPAVILLRLLIRIPDGLTHEHFTYLATRARV